MQPPVHDGAPVRGGQARRPTVALALGGGSARGLAHIPMLEALEELGVRPVAIVGTSFGAIIGACYAAGLTASEIRAHFSQLLQTKRTVVAALRLGRLAHPARLWSWRRPTNLDPVPLFGRLLPARVDRDFAALEIPLTVIAADFYGMTEVRIDEGPVIPAIAASASLPAILAPVRIGGRVLIDGGFVNPTPFDVALPLADVTVAVDVTGAPMQHQDNRLPSPTEANLGAMQILFRSVMREKLACGQPNVLIQPEVEHFGTLDFLRMEEILAAAAPAKADLKRRLGELLLAGAPKTGQ